MEDQRINFLKPEEPIAPTGGKRRWPFVITVLILLAIGTSVYIFWQGSTPEVASAGESGSHVAIEPSFHRILRRLKEFITGGPGELQGKERDRINILLLGMGGPGHDGPFLSD